MDTINPRKLQRTTLNEIAQHAGVSVSTVSLVLSDKAKLRRISSKVISRVQAVAAELDYSPNLLVQSLQQGRTQVMCFYNGFRNLSHNDLYMDRLFTNIQLEAGNRGYDILVHCDFKRPVEETYQKLNGGRADGVLFFAPDPDDALMISLRNSRLPVVLINAQDSEKKLSSVRDDQLMGMKLIADRLLSLGHTRIAALSNIPDGNKDANERVMLLRSYLKAKGIDIPDNWILSNNEYVASEADSAIRYFMAQPSPPTALFCWHDRLGYQVLDSCDRLGVSVPHQLSVISYDGVHWPAKTSHALVSISVDLSALATAAVGLLDDLVEGRDSGVQRILPVALIDGTTVGPPGR